MLGSFTESAVALYEKLSDLVTDQRKFSEATFGADTARGPIGAFRHLAKEANETADRLEADGHVPGTGCSPEALTEMADCFLLLIDGLRRAGRNFGHLVDAARAKLEVNKKREWPAPTDATTPIEHVRAAEPEKPAPAPEAPIPVLAPPPADDQAYERFKAGSIASVAAALAVPPHLLGGIESTEFTEAKFRACVGPFANDFSPEDLAAVVAAGNLDAHEGADWLPYYKASIQVYTDAIGTLTAVLIGLRTGKFQPIGLYNELVRIGRKVSAQQLLAGRGPSALENPEVGATVAGFANQWAGQVLRLFDPRK